MPKALSRTDRHSITSITVPGASRGRQERLFVNGDCFDGAADSRAGGGGESAGGCGVGLLGEGDAVAVEGEDVC